MLPLATCAIGGFAAAWARRVAGLGVGLGVVLGCNVGMHSRPERLPPSRPNCQVRGHVLVIVEREVRQGIKVWVCHEPAERTTNLEGGSRRWNAATGRSVCACKIGWCWEEVVAAAAAVCVELAPLVGMSEYSVFVFCFRQFFAAVDVVRAQSWMVARPKCD